MIRDAEAIENIEVLAQFSKSLLIACPDQNFVTNHIGDDGDT